MLIQFKRSRLRAVIEAVQDGRYITCPKEGYEWEDNELLAVAGACMSELMFRREVRNCETTDERLRCHRKLPFDRLSSRLAVALNYAVCVTSTLGNGLVSERDKTYKTEIIYNDPEFECMKPPKGPDDGPPAPDGSPPQGESPTSGNAVMQTAA